jgi:branched-chain amino acid transport system permease protein
VIAVQDLANGIILGATIGLGAAGLTLTYSILGFANFAHGELITVGAYAALTVLWALAVLAGWGLGQWGPLSFGAPVLVLLAAAMVLTAALALGLERVLFRPLRRRGTMIGLVIASFGASLALRSLVAFAWGPEPWYFTREIAIAREVLPGVRVTADQLFVLALTTALMASLHALLTRTTLGRAMRAMSENPALLAVTGIDPAGVARWTCAIGGALAAVAGLLIGLTGQVRPLLGFELLLPLFAAVILGGVGSVHGALVGSLVVGVAEALAVPLIGGEYRAAVAFLVLIAVLVMRPTGLAGPRP